MFEVVRLREKQVLLSCHGAVPIIKTRRWELCIGTHVLVMRLRSGMADL